MNDITIPTLLFWENKNTWYGSKGDTRFYIQTAAVESPEGETRTELQIEVWKGPLTKALSEVIATHSIPLSEEGLAQTVAWLEEQARQINQTPI